MDTILFDRNIKTEVNIILGSKQQEVLEHIENLIALN